MQNGSEGKPYYPYNSAMNGYRAYAASVSPSMYSPFSPGQGSPTPPLPNVSDQDLPASNGRYDTNGFGTQTPPADALLQDYGAKLMNGTARSGAMENGTLQARASRLLNTDDSVAMHLLVETALGDSVAYDVLSFDEIDRLKTELASLNPKIDSARKKLALENKVRDAAASLNRLYRQSSSTSTPTVLRRLSGSPKKDQDSILKSEEELAVANKKCDDISRELYSLETRQQRIQMQILQHTAGVLQMTHRGPSAKKHLDEFPQSMQHGLANGGRPDSPASIYTYENSRNDIRKGERDDFDERSLYKTPDEMYGISFDAPSKADKAMLQNVARLGERLEDLNARLKEAIMQASKTHEVSPLDAPHDPRSSVVIESINRQVDAIAGNFTALADSHQANGAKIDQLHAQLQQKAYDLEDAVNEKDSQYADVLDDRNRQLAIAQKQVEQLQAQLNDGESTKAQMDTKMLPGMQQANNQLFSLLKAAGSAGFAQQQMPPPPSVDVLDPQLNLEYMSRSLAAFTSTYQNLLALAKGTKDRDMAGKASAAQMDTALDAMWASLVSHDEDLRKRRAAKGERDISKFEANEPFSLQGFGNRMQVALSQAADARTQLEQTEEKHAALSRDLQAQLQQERDNSAKATASSGRAADLEKQLQAKSAEMARIEQVLEANRATTAERQNTLQELRQKLSAQEEELERVRGQSGKEVERLEGDLVRLTTDLTIAKAELDAAYGSRAERRAEADAEAKKQLDDLHAQIAELKTRPAPAAPAAIVTPAGPSPREKELEEELKDTLREFEELTRASVEAEKERDKLEATVDAVSQKLEDVEGQLSEERVKWLGVKNPGEAAAGGAGAASAVSEMASIGTMRAEFKRMMRDQRAEGIKALRAEQDERRRVETQLRQLRKEREVRGGKKSGLSNSISSSS